MEVTSSSLMATFEVGCYWTSEINVSSMAAVCYFPFSTYFAYMFGDLFNFILPKKSKHACMLMNH
jgi:hypothetical protein